MLPWNFSNLLVGSYYLIRFSEFSKRSHLTLLKLSIVRRELRLSPPPFSFSYLWVFVSVTVEKIKRDWYSCLLGTCLSWEALGDFWIHQSNFVSVWNVLQIKVFLFSLKNQHVIMISEGSWRLKADCSHLKHEKKNHF